MKTVESFINSVTGFLWGAPLLLLLVGGGLFLSFRLSFIQFRRFGYVWSQTLGVLFRKSKRESKKKGNHHFM